MNNSSNLFIRDYKAFKLISLSLLLGVFHQTFQTLIPNNLAFDISLLILLFGFLGCFLFFSRHKMSSLSHWFLYLIIYFLAIGSLYGTLYNKVSLTTAINQDLRFVMFFLAGSVFAYSDNRMLYFHRLMKLLAVISIGFGIYALLFFDFSFDSIAARKETWNLNYYMWWASSSCFTYWGYYALFMKKEKLLAFGVLFIYFLLGFLFLKRSAFINVIVIGAVFIFLNRRKKVNTLIKIILGTASALFLLSAVMPMFDSVYGLLFDRFNFNDSFSEFDRNIESAMYFREASFFQIFFGNGIGHYHVISNPLLIERGLLNALHLGYANIVYKGGVFYVLFYIALYYRIFKRAKRNILNPYELVCLGVSISALVSLFYEGTWSYTILPFCIAAPLFYSANEHK